MAEMWIEEHLHELKLTRKRKARNVSWYRQKKLGAHRTVGGRGKVARLMGAKSRPHKRR